MARGIVLSVLKPGPKVPLGLLLYSTDAESRRILGAFPGGPQVGLQLRPRHTFLSERPQGRGSGHHAPHTLHSSELLNALVPSIRRQRLLPQAPLTCQGQESASGRGSQEAQQRIETGQTVVSSSRHQASNCRPLWGPWRAEQNRPQQ